MDVLTPAARRPPRAWREWTAVVIAAFVLSGAVILTGPSDLRGDQHVYNLLVVKLLDPSAFARDVLYHRDPTLLHVPLFLHLHAAVARRLGGDVEAALVWLAWPIGALFLVGHYVLFRAVTGDPGAAALAAVGAMTIRNSLGGELWGYDGTRAAATRTILAGATPMLLLLWMRWRTHRSFPLYYAVLGLLFNVHPVSAYHLAQATGVAHLWLERFRPRALAQLAAGAGLFVLGTLPYVVPFFSAREDASDPATLSLARAALDHRFSDLLYPIGLDRLLSAAFHMALPVAAWIWWRRRRETDALAPLEAVAAAAVVLGFAGAALIQAVGVWRDRPYVDIQELRIVRLVYPVGFAALALVYARLLARRTRGAMAALAAVVVLSLVPPGDLIHAFSKERRDGVKRALGIDVPRAAVAGVVDARPALWAWARTTPAESLFFTDDWAFRIETRRSMTGSEKDGAFLFLAGNRPFTAWYRLQREIAACRVAGGGCCWFDLAARLDADYVVVDPTLAGATPPPGAERVWARDGWSVWRRPAAGG